MSKKVFVRKNYGTLYKWCVNTGPQGNKRRNQAALGCDAVAGSQGQDWISGYVNNRVVVGGQLEQLAYVECGYVQ